MSTPVDLHALVREHGGEVSRDGRTAFMPDIGHSRRDRGLKVMLTDDGRPIVHSFHGQDWREVKRHLGLDDAKPEQISAAELGRRRAARKTAEHERVAAAKRFCAGIWRETQEGAGSPVEAYLAARGLAGPVPGVLRFHPACPRSYPDPAKPIRTAPAMVALVQNVRGEPTGLHVTAIKPDGSGKALGDRSRVMFGEITGGAVRLSEVDPGSELAVAEGIETALSFAALYSKPCWAALSTSMLKAFALPHGVRRLVIAADGDGPGIAAAEGLAERACNQADVAIVAAPGGRDWNDFLQEKRG